jgi:outer membrane murein-binding lipoprotein Lpp
MRRVLIPLLSVVVLAGCTRPAAVRNVATTAQPLVANLQRMATAAGENMTIHRRDLVRSATQYEALRGDQAALVADRREAWLDSGRGDITEQLDRLSVVQESQRADPLATLRPAAPAAAVAPVRIQLQGLTTIARALDRLKGEQGLTARDLAGFVSEVVTETNKLNAERAGETPAAAAPQP